MMISFQAAKEDFFSIQRRGYRVKSLFLTIDIFSLRKGRVLQMVWKSDMTEIGQKSRIKI
jgi:hypothetical protein